MELARVIRNKENLILCRPDISQTTKDKLSQWLKGQGIKNSLVINSSGTSSSTQKFYIIKHQSMLDHAEEILSQFNINSGNTYLKVLPDFFMGGCSINYRSLVGGFKVINLKSYKDMRACVQDQKSDRLLTSLIPFQAYELMKKHYLDWSSFRTVFIGGGETTKLLRNMLAEESDQFYTTYGSTEFCSQLATSKIQELDQGIGFLPFAQIRSHEGEIRIKSPYHFDYLLHFEQDELVNVEAYEDNLDFMSYWKSSDRGQVKKGRLFLQGREGRVIKFKGRLVNLDELEETISLNFKLNQHKFFVGLKQDQLKGVTPCLITQEHLENKVVNRLDDHGIKDVYLTDQIKFTESFKLIRQLDQYHLKKLA